MKFLIKCFSKYYYNNNGYLTLKKRQIMNKNFQGFSSENLLVNQKENYSKINIELNTNQILNNIEKYNPLNIKKRILL